MDLSDGIGRSALHLELNNRWRLIAVVVGLGFVGVGRVPAADVEVVKTGSIKTSLSLNAMRAGVDTASREYRKVLKADLIRSGWFEITDNGASLDVSGMCRVVGGRLSGRCRVVSNGTGKTLLDDPLRAEASQARELAHRTADAIVKAVKGVPGIASTEIVMVGAHLGRQDLYLCDADGGKYGG